MYENSSNKQKYLKAGDLKENIRNLKKDNKQKCQTTYNHFFKQQKKFSDSAIVPTQVDENLYKTLSSFYLTMKSDPMSFYRNHTSKSLNKFDTRSNTSIGFPMIKRDSEADVQPLIGLYHMNLETQNESILGKKEKKDILRSFNIETGLDEKERKFLDTNLKTKSDFYSTNKDFNKTQCTASTYYFMNPEKSLKKLKLNKLIYSSIMNIRTTQQLKSYTQKADKEFDRYIKVSQMPKIKENSKKPIIMDYVDYSIMDKDDQSSNRLWTRNQYMESNIQYDLTYFQENYNDRPSSRSMFSFTLVDNCIYMFGGLKNEKLNEIWKCDIKSKNRY
jgi:hypothetical protein